jgi:hypothetical protein
MKKPQFSNKNPYFPMKNPYFYMKNYEKNPDFL